MRLKIKVGLILLLALIIRLWGLDKLPIELFGDELDAGYQAYSILITGKDYLGHPYPISFHSFSENRSPLFIYSLVPTVAIFGLNEWGVRAAPAFWGTLSIFVLFLVVKKLTDERTALGASILLTITPWHWHYSRAGFEVTLLLLFVLTAVYLWLNQEKRWWFLPISILFMILSLFTYSSAVGFIPFLVVLLFWLFRPERLLAKTKAALFLVVVVGGVFFAVGGGLGQPGQRIGSVSLLSYKSLTDEISSKRGFDGDIFTGEVFHNKPILLLREITANYLKSFSPQFLALGGDPDSTHSETGGGFGELFHIEYLLVILGVGVMVARRKQNFPRFFLGWLVISPISSSVTIGGGEHATRLFIMIPALVVAAAIGFWTLVDTFQRQWQRKIVKIMVFGGLLVEIIFFSHHAVAHYRVESWRAWQYGYKEAMRSLPRGQDGIVTVSDKGEPILIRYLFWSKTDPAWFQKNFSDDKLVKNITPGFDGFRLGPKLLFGNLDEGVSVENFLRPGMTFIAIQGKDIPGNWILDNRSIVGVELIKVVKDPEFSKPLIQVITRK